MSLAGQDRPTQSGRGSGACPLRSESDGRRSKCDPPLRATSGREQMPQTTLHSITPLARAKITHPSASDNGRDCESATGTKQSGDPSVANTLAAGRSLMQSAELYSHPLRVLDVEARLRAPPVLQTAALQL